MAEIDDILERLTELSERKKNIQNAYRDKTAEVNELDGRVYHNLQVLSRVGKAVFEELNDHQHAALYRLSVRKGSKRPVAAEQPPVAAQQACPEAKPARVG